MKTSRVIILVLSIVLILSYQACSKEKIWIDTDIVIGKWGRDVDDGLALIMALRSPEVEIEGISLVSNVDYGYRVTKKLLHWYGNNKIIPVYKGASGSLEPGIENEATLALAKALGAEKLTIIALGPVTNIGAVLKLHPELARQIKGIVWCAGRQPDLHFRPGNGIVTVGDCNFDKDPRSAQILLSSGVKLALTGYEPASYIYISEKDLKSLKNSTFEGDRWLYKKLMHWYRIWHIILGSDKGFMPFDAVTLGCCILPSYMRSFPDIPVTIKLLKNDKCILFGKPVKPYLIASYDLKTSWKADYYYWTDEDFKNDMLRLLVPGTDFRQNNIPGTGLYANGAK